MKCQLSVVTFKRSRGRGGGLILYQIDINRSRRAGACTVAVAVAAAAATATAAATSSRSAAAMIIPIPREMLQIVPTIITSPVCAAGEAPRGESALALLLDMMAHDVGAFLTGRGICVHKVECPVLLFCSVFCICSCSSSFQWWVPR